MSDKNTTITGTALLSANVVGSYSTVSMPTVNQTGNTFTTESGVLRSPNWPANYPTNVYVWTVFTGIPGVARVLVGNITTEAGYDHIRILDGSGISGPVLPDATSMTTGAASSFFFVSGVGQTFTVGFRSDSTGVSSGFNLQVFGIAVAGSPTDVGEIKADTNAIQAKDSTGVFNLRQATRGFADVQVFTANGTWTKPTDRTVTIVRPFIASAGGGGSGGMKGAVQGGGGGGGGAINNYFMIPAQCLGTTESVVVGGAGSGGAGSSTGTGNAGTAGGVSSFSSGATLMSALSGSGGTAPGGGGTAATTAGILALTSFSTPGSGGGGGLSGASGTAGIVGTLFAAGGGGGGGGCGVSTAGNGADGGLGSQYCTPYGTLASSLTLTNYGATSPSSTNGGVLFDSAGHGGFAPPANTSRGSGGGGGGAASVAGIAGNGGVGGTPGGGGGGGGSTNTGTAGSGGNGGSGLVIVVSW